MNDTKVQVTQRLRRRAVTQAGIQRYAQLSELVTQVGQDVQAIKAEGIGAILARLEDILAHLVESDRQHELDRLRHRAAEVFSSCYAFGTFCLAISIASFSAFAGAVDGAVQFSSLLALVGGFSYSAGFFLQMGTKRAGKLDYPEDDPAYTEDPWYSFFNPYYWRWVFQSNKWIFLHLLCVAGLGVLAILLIPVTIGAL